MAVSSDINAPFSYPGGKSHLAPWVAKQLPADHRAYVEPFGGAAAVLFEKERSRVEVYNDLNSDVVTFFRVARERPGELREHMRGIPYSREVHQRLLGEWYDDGHRPDDDVQRAAEFAFLRTSNYGSMHRRSGFTATAVRNASQVWDNVAKRVDAVAERFRGVIIEHSEWTGVVEQYDTPETLFYCDPPYVESTDVGLYATDATSFDHVELAETMATIDGRCLVSYSEVPDAFDRDAFTVLTTDGHWHMATAKESGDGAVDERLVCNFDPHTTATFSSADQPTLTEFTDET